MMMRSNLPTLAGPGKRALRGKPSAASPHGGHRSGRGTANRILLASGDAAERAVWRAMLADPDYIVSEAENGEAALAAIVAGATDLVIAAVVMTVIDGLELLRAVQDLEEAPPIVLIASGRGKIDQIYMKSATLLGAAAFHMQPFEAGEFQTNIREVLRSRQNRPDEF